jgi:predicted metal-dependent enzyme (double-stranded beta helix superfamily)
LLIRTALDARRLRYGECMFSLDRFINACRAAAAKPDAQAAVAAVLADAVGHTNLWDRHLSTIQGADDRGVARLFVDDSLTLLHVNLAPGFVSRIHSHGLWTAVGVYEGQEDNLLFGLSGDGVVQVGRRAVGVPDVLQLRANSIHAIANPLDRPLRAFHAYGGDLRVSVRHRWDTLAGPPIPEGGAATDSAATDTAG